MNIEQFREYCLSKKGSGESFPFDEQALVFKVMNKMFAITGLEHHPPVVNLKCDPERSAALRDEYDGKIYGAFHMNKLHWNSILIEAVPAELTRELIDHSYDLVVNKLTKKARAELDNS